MFTSNNSKYSIYQIESRRMKKIKNWTNSTCARVCNYYYKAFRFFFLLFAVVLEASRAHIAHEFDLKTISMQIFKHQYIIVWLPGKFLISIKNKKRREIHLSIQTNHSSRAFQWQQQPINPFWNRFIWWQQIKIHRDVNESNNLMIIDKCRFIQIDSPMKSSIQHTF